MINKRKPRHPGALIKRQYLEPLEMTNTQLAEILGVSRKTVSEIVNEQASVSPIMALRLAKAFQTTPELWLNLQQKYDLWNAAQESEILNKISPIIAQFIQQMITHARSHLITNLHQNELHLCKVG